MTFNPEDLNEGEAQVHQDFCKGTMLLVWVVGQTTGAFILINSADLETEADLDQARTNMVEAVAQAFEEGGDFKAEELGSVVIDGAEIDPRNLRLHKAMYLPKPGSALAKLLGEKRRN